MTQNSNVENRLWLSETGVEAGGIGEGGQHVQTPVIK